MLACAFHTPLDVIWHMTIGQIVRYTKAVPAVMPFHNPFAGGGAEGAPGTPPDAIDADKNPGPVRLAALASGTFPRPVQCPHDRSEAK